MAESEPFRQLLAADLALVLEVAQAQDVASALERYWSERSELETDLGRELSRVAGIGIADLQRIEAEVDRLIDAAGGDSRLALSMRGGIGASIHASLDARMTCTLSGWGAGPRVELRPIAAGRYRAAECIGQGGMGVVYLALDTELNRRVALKVMRPGAGVDDPLALAPAPNAAASPVIAGRSARFLREAWITSTLEHPGVVPIHAVGRTAAGLPYYTMRYVRGDETLRHAIRSAADLDERLGLIEPFLRACDAVRYAHARGVLHCDIKPANIALGTFGEAIVLDWGLALTQDLPERVDAPVGTPGYMSPEAARLREDQPSEAWDIYALGATLHEILTGSPPIAFQDFADYRHKLAAGGLPTPATIDASIPSALSVLCERALDPDPAARPASVDAFVAAIRAWQRQAEVNRETAVLVAEAEAALSQAAGGTGARAVAELDRVAAYLERVRTLDADHARIGELSRRAEEARAAALAHRERTSRKRLLRRVAVVALVVAAVAGSAGAWLLDRARRNAERERAQADGLAWFLLDDVYRELEKVDRLDVLEPVVERAARYYHSAEPGEARAGALVPYATALRRLGNLSHRAGDVQEAVASYDEAIRLLRAEPRLTGLGRALLASCLADRSDAAFDRGNLDAAHALALESLRMRRQLRDSGARSAAQRRHLADSLRQSARVLARLGERDAALRRLEEAEGLLDVGEAKTDVAASRALGRIWEARASVLEERGDLDAAIQWMERAVRLTDRAVAREPGDVTTLRLSATLRRRLGGLQLSALRTGAALESYDAALTTRRAIAAQNPGDLVRRYELAETLAATAEVQRRRGAKEDSAARFDEAVALLEPIVRADPSRLAWVRELAHTWMRFASILAEIGEHERAGPAAARATAAYADLVRESPDHLPWRQEHALSLHARAQVCSLAGRPEEALLPLEQAAQIERQALARPDAGPRWRRLLAHALRERGRALVLLERRDEALTAYLESVRLLRALTELDPANGEWSDGLARVSVEVGDILRKAKRLEESLPHFRAAARAQARLVEAAPENSALRQLLARSHAMIASSHAEAGRTEAAANAYREAFEQFSVAARLTPGLDRTLGWYAKEHGTYALFAGHREPANTWDEWVLAGHLFVRERRFAEAVVYFERVVLVPKYRRPPSTLLRDAAECAHEAALRAEGEKAERLRRLAASWRKADAELQVRRIAELEAELKRIEPSAKLREKILGELQGLRARLATPAYRKALGVEPTPEVATDPNQLRREQRR